MIRLLLLTILLITQAIYSQQSLKTLTNKYEPYYKELNQGLSILTQKNGVTETHTIGDYNFNKHTVFNIGSATKKMTAILILQEVEKGNLKLNDSIGTYLNPLKNVDPNLTIEALLRHKSGLGELIAGNFETTYFAKSDSIYNSNLLLNIPKNNPKKVGKFSYCNTNYFLLGKILEKVTDKSYFDLLRERIFTPCNMKESYAYISKNIKNLAPPIHKGKDVSEYLDYRYFANYAYAAGSVASTLNDMAKFYQHLFENNTLLSNESVKQLINFKDDKYALGMIKLSDGYIGHGGNNMGYSYREYYNIKNKNLVLLFSNSTRIPLRKLLKKDLLKNIKGEASTINFDTKIAQTFKKAIGKYQFDSHGIKMEMEIVKKNDHLYFSAQGAQVILISTKKNQLKNTSIGIVIEPKNNNELVFKQNGLEATITRIKS